MPECRCGEAVSQAYVRVFSPEDGDLEAAEHDVRSCPWCATVRDDGEVRQARSMYERFERGESA